MHFITVGYAESRRVNEWHTLLNARGFSSTLWSYHELIKGEFPSITADAVLRICSPGEDFKTYKEIVSFGSKHIGQNLKERFGEVADGKSWYLGWKKVLQVISIFLKKNPRVRVMNSPEAIAIAFDKHQSKTQFNLAKVNTPRYFYPVDSVDTLFNNMLSRKWHQVFIKPLHGSSASGIMALRRSSSKMILYSTIVQGQGENVGHLFNALKVQRYSDQNEIRVIVKKMLDRDLLCEQWIPKKKHTGKNTDFRVLVVNGKATFVVPRLSAHNITNLHLGNEKGNIEACKQEWGESLIHEMVTLAVQAVKSIPDLFYAGVDVLVSTDDIPFVLEVNAFGDLLIGLEFQGMTSSEVLLKECLNVFTPK